MNVGSLFAGIGGFDLGFERAGMSTAWQVEIDPFCRRVLERHFPGAERYDDVCEVGAHNLEPVDVVCGGFPCQDLSLAGKGAGIDGARSGLWAEYARIVGELRPRYVVVENVPALLTRGFERVLADLAALGYDAEWDCLPASAFGAPHRRDRIWLVAYPDSESESSKPINEEQGCGFMVSGGDVPYPDSEGPQGHGGERRLGSRSRETEAGGRRSDGGTATMGDAELSGLARRFDGGTSARTGPSSEPERSSHLVESYWSIEPDVGRVANGIPDRVDRLKSLGNALVPQIAEWIGRRIMEWEK